MSEKKIQFFRTHFCNLSGNQPWLIFVIFRQKRGFNSNLDNIEENLRRRNKHYTVPVVTETIGSSSLQSKGGIQLDKPLNKKSAVATKGSPRQSSSNARKSTPTKNNTSNKKGEYSHIDYQESP